MARDVSASRAPALISLPIPFPNFSALSQPSSSIPNPQRQRFRRTLQLSIVAIRCRCRGVEGKTDLASLKKVRASSY